MGWAGGRSPGCTPRCDDNFAGFDAQPPDLLPQFEGQAVEGMKG
jgi:hypothetical protein